MVSFSFCLVNGSRAVFVGHDLSHGVSVEFDAMGVVDDSVEDGIGKGRFADDLVSIGVEH